MPLFVSVPSQQLVNPRGPEMAPVGTSLPGLQCIANIFIFVDIQTKFEQRISSDIHSSILRWMNIFKYSFGEEHYIRCTKIQG